MFKLIIQALIKCSCQLLQKIKESTFKYFRPTLRCIHALFLWTLKGQYKVTVYFVNKVSGVY